MSLRVPHDQASAAQVRWRLAADLRAAHVTAHVADDALLILSELVTNAVRHARPLAPGGLRVSWQISPAAVGVSVTDGGAATAPVATAVATSAPTGRGLHIVHQLASGWDVTSSAEGTTVWAVVTRAVHA